jgi:putative phage-type endonuclease
MATDEEKRRQFLEERRTGLGSSDVAAVLGYDQFRTPLDVYMSKVLPVEVEAPGPDAQRGIDLEPIAADKYQAHSGLALMEVPTQRHPTHPWAMASVDRLGFDVSQLGETMPVGLVDKLVGAMGMEVHDLAPDEVVEIKCPRARTYGTWRREGLPERTTIQTVWQLGIVLVPRLVVWAWCADAWEGTPVQVDPRPRMFDAMLNQAGAWWERHVVAGVPPPLGPVPQADVGKLPTLAVGEPIHMVDPEAEPALAQALQLGARAQLLYGVAKANREASRARLKEQMENLAVVELYGVARAYYRTQKGGSDFDVATLKADAPLDRQAVADYLKASTDETDTYIYQVLEDCGLDLEQYRKARADSRPLRLYPLGEEG